MLRSHLECSCCAWPSRTIYLPLGTFLARNDISQNPCLFFLMEKIPVTPNVVNLTSFCPELYQSIDSLIYPYSTYMFFLWEHLCWFFQEYSIMFEEKWDYIGMHEICVLHSNKKLQKNCENQEKGRDVHSAQTIWTLSAAFYNFHFQRKESIHFYAWTAQLLHQSILKV